MPETILVTGGAGFIGSHLAAEGIAHGDRVIVLDSLVTGHRENVPTGAEFLHRDLADPGLEQFLTDRGVTVVSHHAAQANVRVSVDDPVHDARANVVGSLQLLQACRRAGIRRFYFASSGGTVYGHQREFPATEDHPTRPTSPYGCSKLAVEHYLLAFGRVGELEPVIVRYANVYGARQDPKGEAGIVAILAEKLLAGEPPTIFGDGSQTRDYVHVDDVTAAHRAVIRAWQPGVYNFGTGIESSVNQVLAEVSVRLGSRIEPRHAPANPAEILRSSLSPERFVTTFGVRPTVPLGEGLDRTLPFYRRRAVPAEAR